MEAEFNRRLKIHNLKTSTWLPRYQQAEEMLLSLIGKGKKVAFAPIWSCDMMLCPAVPMHLAQAHSYRV